MRDVPSGIELRDATVGDADALAAAWTDFGRYYVDLDPEHFRLPHKDGLPAWFESSLREDRGEDALWLVAERGDRVVGFIRARIWPRADDADFQLMWEVAEPILKIESLMVLDGERGAGVGTALMDAAERWGREHGATRAGVISYANSPASMPFYEERMGYRRHTVGFLKSL